MSRGRFPQGGPVRVSDGPPYFFGGNAALTLQTTVLDRSFGPPAGRPPPCRLALYANTRRRARTASFSI